MIAAIAFNNFAFCSAVPTVIRTCPFRPGVLHIGPGFALLEALVDRPAPGFGAVASRKFDSLGTTAKPIFRSCGTAARARSMTFCQVPGRRPGR